MPKQACAPPRIKKSLRKICASEYLPLYSQVNTCILEARRDIFQAIADPTRREIIHLISSKPENLTTLSENFNMTRQAVTLHIKILHECGLIHITQQGRERYCELIPEKLEEVDQWISHYRIFWSKKFTSLKKFIDTENKTQRKKK